MYLKGRKFTINLYGSSSDSVYLNRNIGELSIIRLGANGRINSYSEVHLGESFLLIGMCPLLCPTKVDFVLVGKQHYRSFICLAKQLECTIGR